MSSSITLSAATRQNLLSLQDTAAMMSTTQNRLSTGKKVNSALDNPVNFFTAQSLNSRSSDLNGLLDGISNGIQVIQAANQGITSIQKLVDQAKSITSQAIASKNTTTEGTGANVMPAPEDGTLKIEVNGVEKTFDISEYVEADPTATPPVVESGDSRQDVVDKLNAAIGTKVFTLGSDDKLVASGAANVKIKDADTATALGLSAPATGEASADFKVEDKTRTSLAKQFNALLTQIDQMAKDASFNGVNLISNGEKSNKLHVQFNENDSASLDIDGVDLTTGEKGLNIAAIDMEDATKAFQSDDDITTTVSSLNSASSTLRAQSSTFGSNLSVVQNRQDFSKQLINILTTGASNLTDADLNAEAANSQALSTRQSLSISALSLANQAQQGILQLLR
ncbi:flagellin N-terminal helical domain-containing protein [Methylorubrum aminovorans]